VEDLMTEYQAGDAVTVTLVGVDKGRDWTRSGLRLKRISDRKAQIDAPSRRIRKSASSIERLRYAFDSVPVGTRIVVTPAGVEESERPPLTGTVRRGYGSRLSILLDDSRPEP
jgi:hypothetical protein